MLSGCSPQTAAREPFQEGYIVQINMMFVDGVTGDAARGVVQIQIEYAINCSLGASFGHGLHQIVGAQWRPSRPPRRGLDHRPLTVAASLTRPAGTVHVLSMVWRRDTNVT
jgi:hypothetical protein